MFIQNFVHMLFTSFIFILHPSSLFTKSLMFCSFVPVNQNFCSDTQATTHTAVSALFLAVDSKPSVGAVQQPAQHAERRGHDGPQQQECTECDQLTSELLIEKTDV